MALTWRKQPNETGLARVTQGPRGFQLRKDGEIVMWVAPLLVRWKSYDIVGWYFYGAGANTSHEPCATAEEAKTQAKKHYLETLTRQNLNPPPSKQSN